MIGRRSEEVLSRAARLALEMQHEYCTVEHVFWAMLEETDVRDAIVACEAIPDELRIELHAYLENEFPKPLPPNDAGPSSDSLPEEAPLVTVAVQRLLQMALFQIQSAGKREVQPVDMLVALFQAKDSWSLYLLQKHGVERLDVLNFVSHGVGSSGDAPVPAEGEPRGESTRNTDPLKAYTVNLNELAKEGRIDPLIGRQTEMDRMLQTLCRRLKNNPVLVGEAGVGKTALAEGLALRIVNGEVPSLLKEAEVFALDLGNLLAGAKFRGDFEQRLKRVLEAIKKKRAKGMFPILFIDEIHTIIGAGSAGGSVLDAANMLKPLLSRGEIRCIGSTTYTEYRNTFEKDSALARRFQKIDVPEPTPDETFQILKGLRPKFEEHHEVKITDEALRAAVDLSVKHITDRFLPDKAIDLVDEAGAKARLAARDTVDVPLLEEVAAQIARVPVKSVTIDQKQRLKNLERDLKFLIFGQSHAIDVLVTAIRLARSGLRGGEKPVGSFLFCGPTGVGKTELSKQLAFSLGVPFQRFDMSEYMEKHSVSRLIGAPPGYVGFEQAGLLTEAVRKNPYCVILMDEIEKAHPDLMNILLQVMDHGALTDNYGRKSDFRNVILVMTSNVGAREMERRPVGMGGPEAMGSPKKEVERYFSPEFRNRLDGIVYFNPLSPETMKQVVSKQLAELEAQLLAKGVEIDVDASVKDWLAEKGYDRAMGARPLARFIQDNLRKALAEEILFGALEKGGRVRITIKDGEPSFTFEAEGAEKASGQGNGSKQDGKETLPVKRS